MLVPGLMILFAVLNGRRAVCVCGEIMKLRGSLVKLIWHGLLPPMVS